MLAMNSHDAAVGKKRTKFILLVVGIVLVVVFFGRSTIQGQPSTTPKVPTATAQAAPTTEDLLKTQIEIMRAYDSRMLSVVYWSLSGVFLLVVLVGGINWFTNFRLYERERDNLRESVKMEAERQAVALQSKTEDFRRDALKQAAQMKENFEKFQAALVNQMNERVVERTKAAIADLRKEFLSERRDSIGFRAEYYHKVGDDYREFDSWLDYLSVLKEIGWFKPDFIGKPLQRLTALLEKPTATVSFRMQTKAIELFKDPPEAFRGEVARFRTLLEKARKI
jgi:flagellar basal body-associated protein FliL